MTQNYYRVMQNIYKMTRKTQNVWRQNDAQKLQSDKSISYTEIDTKQRCKTT